MPLTAGTIAAVETGTTTATITIQPPTGGSPGYRVVLYRATSPNPVASGNEVPSCDGVTISTTLTVYDTGLSPSTTYYYEAGYVDSIPNIVDSNQVSITTPAPPSLTVPALCGQATGPTTASILLDGTVSGGTSPYYYQFYRNTTGASFVGGDAVGSSNPDPRALQDTGLTANTTYHYGLGVADSSTPTPIVTFSPTFVLTPSAGPYPGIPTVTSITPTTINITASAEVGGTAPITRQWYRSSVNNDTPGNGTCTAISGATGLTLADTPTAPPASQGHVWWYFLVSTDATPHSIRSQDCAAPLADHPPLDVLSLGTSIVYLGGAPPTTARRRTVPASWG